MPRNPAVAGLLPRLSCLLLGLLLGSCARGPQPPQTAAAPDSPAESRLADEPTRLADDYVREFVARFPESAELSGLQIERHDGLTDNSLADLADWQRFEDRLAERLARLREIFALREEAERELGARFDLRAFHDTVLGSGAITLPMLRQKLESWIRRSRTAPSSP